MNFRRPDPAVVVAAAALLVAMGGSAVAGSLITSKQIKDGTIQLRDINKTARVQLKGARGPRGEPGPQGAAGAAGSPAAYAFVRTEGCCLGAPPLDPPMLTNAHNVVSAARTGTTGEWDVTFDAAALPSGTAARCVALVSSGSVDGARAAGGEPGTRIDPSAPANTLKVDFRNSSGALSEIGNGNGALGFAIALFC
jgi:hypothetical protein